MLNISGFHSNTNRFESSFVQLLSCQMLIPCQKIKNKASEQLSLLSQQQCSTAAFCCCIMMNCTVLYVGGSVLGEKLRVGCSRSLTILPMYVLSQTLELYIQLIAFCVAHHQIRKKRRKWAHTPPMSGFLANSLLLWKLLLPSITFFHTEQYNFRLYSKSNQEKDVFGYCSISYECPAGSNFFSTSSSHFNDLQVHLSRSGPKKKIDKKKDDLYWNTQIQTVWTKKIK